MKSPKIVIIGIDGATFRLIKPWSEQGKLPNISRLMEQGTWGTLESTIPPLSPPAWTSFATGKNPGKHGLFHFISPQLNNYSYFYTNAKTRKTRTIWRILSDQGFRVGVVNIPMTYPPEAINGFMISGLDTPSERSEFVYPLSLKQELLDHFGKIRLEIRHLEFMRSDQKREAVLREFADLEKHRAQLALYLLEKHPVDVFMLVFCSVDQVQHYFWHFMDQEHYRYNPDDSKLFGNAILRAYQNIDHHIGNIKDFVSDDSIFILMSDHGAGPTSKTIIHVNQFLANIGVLEYKEQKRSILEETIHAADPIIRKILPPRLKARVACHLPGFRKKWESRLSSISAIEWTRTKAFCYEIMPTNTNIWVNLRDKFPHGIVNPGSEYEELLSFLEEEFYSLRNPLTGEQLIQRIYRKNEIYQGPHLDLAPDLVMSWWQDTSFSLRPSSRHMQQNAIDHLERQSDKLINWSGTHRPDGIFLLQGPPIKNLHCQERVQIYSLAPTILYLMNCEIPRDLDGQIIADAFFKSYLEQHKPLYSEKTPADHATLPTDQRDYSEDEEEEIKKSLRSLGYIS